MRIFSINYDLHSPGQRYKELKKELEKYDFQHILESTWLIYTTDSAEQITTKIRKYLDSNDFLLVAEFGNSYQGYLPTSVWDWISKRKTSNY